MNNEMQNDVVDFKITKRHFPRINNASVLEFVFEKDPNLFMRKNKIVIKGAIEVDRYIFPNISFIYRNLVDISLKMASLRNCFRC